MHVTPATMRRWITEGVVPAYRLGPRKLLINPADLDALLQPVTATPKPSTSKPTADTEPAELKRPAFSPTDSEPAREPAERDDSPEALALFAGESTTATEASSKPKPLAVGGRRRGPEPADQRARCRSAIVKALAENPEGVTAGWLHSNRLDKNSRPHRDDVLAELVAEGLALLDGKTYRSASA